LTRRENEDELLGDFVATTLSAQSEDVMHGSTMSPAQRLWREKLLLVRVAFIIGIVLFCFLGPVFYHTNQVETNLAIANLRPSSAHPFGTDPLGYDVLGRIMAGGQSSLEIGLGVGILATALGASWGALAGLAGGALDAVMMRVVDVLLSIPAVFVVIFLATIVRPTRLLLILVISLISWLVPARLVRGETLALRTYGFVEAARVVGARRGRIIAKHIIPNTMGVIAVNVTFQIADAILLMSLLSFLGFGLPAPAATWGGMLATGIAYIYDGYWWELYPAGVALVVTVVAFNLLGDSVRDLLDVRLRER